MMLPVKSYSLVSTIKSQNTLYLEDKERQLRNEIKKQYPVALWPCDNQTLKNLKDSGLFPEIFS